MRALLGLAVLAALLVAAGARAAPARRTEPFIVGGAPVAAEDGVPWAAKLFVFSGGALRGQCTGSLIGDRWVLTAAHCVTDVDGPDPTAFLPGMVVRAVLGRADLAAPGADVVDSVNAFVFSTWDPGRARDDVALVELSRPVPERAIPLMRPDQARLAAPGTLGSSAGWGLVGDGAVQAPLALQAVTLPLLSDAACAAAYPPGAPDVPAYDPSAHLCAGPPGGGAGVCNGDSGGPLSVPDGLGGAVLAGVTSWSRGCAAPGSPSVFARVTTYVGDLVRAMSGSDAPVGPPGAVTGPPAPSAGAAALTGTVDPAGLATTYRVDFGPTAGYGTVAAAGYAGDGHAPVGVSLTVGGLAPGSTWHYRVVAESAAGEAVGADVAVTVPGGGAAAAAQARPTVKREPAAARKAKPKAKPKPKPRTAPCRRLRGGARTRCLRAHRRTARRAVHRHRAPAHPRAPARKAQPSR